jgi:malate permease and related proteins
MSNLLLLVCCFLAGMLLRRSGRVPEGAHSTLTTVIVYLALPAVTLHALHSFRFDGSQFWPVLMPWFLFGVGALIFGLIDWWLGLGRTSIGALTLVGGLGNTSFVGLPMIESLQGRDGLALGLLIDQLGSYLALSTVGVFAVAVYAVGKQGSLRSKVGEIATFPPFVALVVALVSRSVPMPADFDRVLVRIGDTMAPLALIAVGLQLRIDAIRDKVALLSLGLGYKLIVCPALVVAILWLLDADIDMTNHVSVIEAAMPPMIGAGIVASQADLDTPLVSTMIGIGIPLGLSTSLAWHWLFMHVLA